MKVPGDIAMPRAKLCVGEQCGSLWVVLPDKLSQTQTSDSVFILHLDSLRSNITLLVYNQRGKGCIRKREDHDERKEDIKMHEINEQQQLGTESTGEEVIRGTIKK